MARAQARSRTEEAILLFVPLILLVVACGGDGPSAPDDSDDPSDPSDTERILFEVPEWAPNHNGGGLTFDNDGYLYLGLGDGGGGGDNQDNAQDPTNLLGTILRLEVLDAEPYFRPPAGNPFTGDGDDRRDEIFAYGLRNPWRVTVDPVTNTIWTGDVGQDAWEEIDMIEAGGNYGWDCREGAHDYTGTGSPSDACGQASMFTDPMWEYAHGSGRGSITGGYVYRGTAHPGLVGKYVYADFISGEIWALEWEASNPANERLVDAPFLVSSFGVDQDGELYILEYASDAKIHRLESGGGGGYELVEAFPNLTFENPVDLRHARDRSGRLFVVEQGGFIRVFDAGSPDSSSIYLDVSDRVTCCGERGLLGLAFHPDFSANGFFYVYYTTGGSQLIGRLSRFTGE